MGIRKNEEGVVSDAGLGGSFLGIGWCFRPDSDGLRDG